MFLKVKGVNFFGHCRNYGPYYAKDLSFDGISTGSVLQRFPLFDSLPGVWFGMFEV